MHSHSMLYHALYQRTERYQFYTNGKISMASDAAAAAAKRRDLAFILSFKNANIEFNELWLVCLACHETCVHSAHHGAFDETLRKLRVFTYRLAFQIAIKIAYHRIKQAMAFPLPFNHRAIRTSIHTNAMWWSPLKRWIYVIRRSNRIHRTKITSIFNMCRMESSIPLWFIGFFFASI